MDAHVAKPVDPDALFGVIADVLAGRPVAPAASPPLVAREGAPFAELSAHLGPDGIAGLMATFVVQAEEACRILAEETGDMLRLHMAAHDLKSMAGTAGCLPLAEIAALIEGAARDGRADEVRRHLEPLGRVWRATRSEMEARFGLSQPLSDSTVPAR